MEEKQRFEILLESLVSKVDAIAEGQSILDSKVDKLDNKFNKLENDMKIIKTYMYAIDDNLNAHEKRIRKLETAIKHF